MDRVGILVISKCLSSSAIIGTFMRSDRYKPEFYVAERQVNPFNFERAKVHQVIPDLNINEITKFVSRHKEQIAFGLTDTEDFVTAGGRDIVEKETGVPMICVTKKYAIERSKADQRLLFDEILPEANPRYAILDPSQYHSNEAAIADLRKIAGELGEIVIKPDAPARGAGVGVWGSDFRTEDEMVKFFLNVYSKGRVVVEEKIEGEESSFQAFSDGRDLFVAPLTRDYKRALDDNKGRLTGGMGSYRDSSYSLPMLLPSEWEKVVHAEQVAFNRWKERGSNPDLRGIILYDALMHTGSGFKILERNSRGGNTEQINILTTLEDDFIDVCYHIIDGALRSIKFSKNASVVTCAVPLAYGTSTSSYAHERINLKNAYELEKKYDGKLRVFPMDVRSENGSVHVGTSRSVAVVGIGSSIEDAREISLLGIRALDGPLRYRTDIASRLDIQRSSDHLSSLRMMQTTAS
jgi:phosphoribosylamine--glycine ligase